MVVVVQMRHLEYFMYLYLDYWLLVACSHTEITSAVRTLCSLLTTFGVCINFIGAHLDSLVACATFPADCFVVLTIFVEDLSCNPCTMVCHCFCLLSTRRPAPM